MDQPTVEGIYRMVALACAAMVADKSRDHTHVMGIADSFLDYIDPALAERARTKPDATLLDPPSRSMDRG